jgi:hypothetical protein
MEEKGKSGQYLGFSLKGNIHVKCSLLTSMPTVHLSSRNRAAIQSKGSRSPTAGWLWLQESTYCVVFFFQPGKQE